MKKHRVDHSRLKKRKKIIIITVSAVLICAIAAFYMIDSARVGIELDRYKNVAVYDNGMIFIRSNGKNYSEDGYYCGQKWQCVEYIKRFYHDAKNHEMPDVYGDANDFFDPAVEHGHINEGRGLIQYKNGEDVSPQPDDLLVFNDTKYGHAGIITEVSETYIEIIQQNVNSKTRDRLPLKIENGKYFVGDKRKPAGWLRLQ